MTNTTTPRVRVERRGEIAILWFDRPPVNAIDLGVLRAADVHLAALERDTDLRGLVLTGAGRCFSAGLDLKAVPQYTRAEQAETIVTLNRVVTRLYRLPIPTVAAVNGHAIAGGLVLALTCDVRIAADGPCELGLTEARAGIPFPAAPLAVVRAELAPAVVRRLTLVARNVDPARALLDGIVDELHPAVGVLDRALAVAAQLAAAPRTAYGQVKRQFRAEVIAALDRLVASNTDPLVDAWLSGDTATAANAVLARPD
jgi:enoyl-CoA hydratase